MARYSIMVMEYGSDHEVELCQLNGNPEHTVAGLKQKTLMVNLVGSKSRRRSRTQKYTSIRVVDREATDAQA